MLFVNSYSEIEQRIFDLLAITQSISKHNITSFYSSEKLKDLKDSESEDVLLYSFQQLDYYRHYNSFHNEVKAVQVLVNHIINKKFKKIILISYPGAYFNSANLFLQHKGIIEQIFVNSGIPTTILNVQAISDSSLNTSNLQALFLNSNQEKLIIPKYHNNKIYTIQMLNLVEIIQKAKGNNSIGKFDVFDTVMDLNTFLSSYSTIDSIQPIMPFFLYFLSYFERYMSPTMLELFLISDIRMFKFRTEKEFDISLYAEQNLTNKLVAKFSQFEIFRHNAVLKALLPIE